MSVDLLQYIAGGCFVAKRVPRPAYTDPELMPENIVSVSESLGGILQAYWGGAAMLYKEKMVKFGIPEDKHEEFAAWSRKNDDIGHPNTFFTLARAREFVARFMPDATDIMLLGVALHRDLVPTFLEESKQVVFDPVREKYIHSDHHATPRVLKIREYPHPGELLGFEILGYDAGFWSWLRSGLEKHIDRALGIRPNQYSLINTYEEALQIHNWILEDQKSGDNAEPIPYNPWLIIRYPPLLADTPPIKP